MTWRIFAICFFFFSSRRRHTRSLRDWSSDVCSSDLGAGVYVVRWVSTSRLDGHVLRGSFQFGIAAVPAGQAEVAVGPTAGKGWLGLIGRWLRLAGLLLW